MDIALQISRRWWLAALLAVSAGFIPDGAAGQGVMRAGSNAPPRQLRPTGSGIRSTTAPRPAHLASHTRVVTQDEIVEGATYMEDPETGQLLATDGMMLPGAPTTARAVQPRTATAQPAIPPRMAMGQPTPQPAPAGSKGEVITEQVYEPGYGDMFMESHGPSCGDVCCAAPCELVPAGNLELFAGVQGFTGPRNRGGNSSFGFNEGLNWAIPIPGFMTLGGQVGFRAVQSSLSGAEFTNSSRDQGFVTGGLFRRVDVGLQGGVVVDYMTEGWYNDVDLVNLRGELSYMIDGIHEVGFWMSASTSSAEEFTVGGGTELESWSATDLYAFFYRMQFGGCRDGEARVFAGWTDDSDGLIGVDTRLPLGANWALETNFAYLIPSQGAGTGPEAGHVQESWNIGMNLVWYPGQFLGRGDYYYRPLFRVADNGNFMVDRD